MPDGRVIAPGTIVSMNAWVLSRNREISGKDVDTFRPERWLRGEFESENAFEAKIEENERRGTNIRRRQQNVH